MLEDITYKNMWGLEYILPFGSKDRFLAFRKVRGSSVSSLGGGGWLMTIILAISVLNIFWEFIEIWNHKEIVHWKI